MAAVSNCQLTDLATLSTQPGQVEVTTWRGDEALRVDGGLVLVRDSGLPNGSIDVEIGVEGAAYPGLAFRGQDEGNFELAYAVPHVSGQWDALQYDPVFNGSNTWQIYYGPGYQQQTDVPTGEWFRFHVEFLRDSALIAVDDQPPLVIDHLARPESAAAFGLWTFRPAYFRNLCWSTSCSPELAERRSSIAQPAQLAPWFLEGVGPVEAEPNGAINLNRFLQPREEPALLTTQFELEEAGEVEFLFGFSDELNLRIDGRGVFEGANTFQGFADRAARGYVELAGHGHRESLAAGKHTVSAELRLAEPFGWGIILTANGPGLLWRPS